jgi:hypothetical protein
MMMMQAMKMHAASSAWSLVDLGTSLWVREWTVLMVVLLLTPLLTPLPILARRFPKTGASEPHRLVHARRVH